MQGAGAVFGLEALFSRYFCSRGSHGGVFPALCFLLGNQESEGGRLSRSWSPRGELGVGVDAAVGFLGVGVVGCVFVLDMVLVTYN